MPGLELFICPLCTNQHAAYRFGTPLFRIYQCAGCALTFGLPSPQGNTSTGELADRAVSRGAGEDTSRALAAALTKSAASGPTLIVAAAADDIAPELQRNGVAIGQVAEPRELASNDAHHSYGAAVVSDVLMQVANPRVVLADIRRHMIRGAPLLISVPLLNGDQARMGRNWQFWQLRNRWYFSRETLNLLLLAAGFEKVWIEVLPSGLALVTAIAAPTDSRADPVVSIIVPVFNEAATLQTMMDGLLAKPLEGLRKQIIVVESNSTDGSRDLVRGYEKHADITVIYQPTPRGKGNAVRDGLRVATGDIVMIQDADLEYDFDDYDGLLAPLRAWQTMFVLGSRHEGSWKVRKFNDAPLTATIFNFGHWLFKSLINIVLGTQMSDPFTMFKLFRRDALHGTNLVGNRFDLDIELVIKFVRKGYIPIELPVNYTARTFAEGKKVSLTRDGLTWFWTILKMRWAPLGPT